MNHTPLSYVKDGYSLLQVFAARLTRVPSIKDRGIVD